jgi:chromosome segregation ATPase
MMSFAQNSQNAGSPVDKTKIIQKLLAEIDAGNERIQALEQREQKLTEEIAKADAAHVELTEAHKQALLELGEVRATIKFQKAEIEDYKKQVDLWKNEAAQAKKELKTSRKRELILTVALILRSLL